MPITIDDREFREALKLYREATKKDTVEVVNRAAMNIAFRAMQFTPQADRAKLEVLFRQQTATQIAGKSGRKLKKAKAVYAGTTAAKAIYLWRLHRDGKPIPTDIDGAVLRFVNRALASIAFFKAGWLPAAKKLQSVVKGGRSGSTKDAGRSRAGKGAVSIAYEGQGLRPVCEIVNQSVTESNPTSAKALVQFGLPALQKAVAFVANDMRQYAEGLMAKRAREYSAK